MLTISYFIEIGGYGGLMKLRGISLLLFGAFAPFSVAPAQTVQATFAQIDHAINMLTPGTSLAPAQPSLPAGSPAIPRQGGDNATAINIRGAGVLQSQTTIATDTNQVADLPIRPSYERVQADQLRALSSRLRHLTEARRAAPSDEFLRSLRHSQALIAAAATSDNASERNAWLTAVQGDLEVKVAYLAAAPANAGYNVNLSVVTKRGAQVVNGYQIGVVPIYLQGSQPEYMLDTVTSPAVGDVTAGRYEVVVRELSRDVIRQVHRIGLTGQSAQSIEVAVP